MTQTPFGTSLGRRLLQVVLSTTGVALMLSATALLIYELRIYHDASTADMQTQADIVARASVQALNAGDRQSVLDDLELLRLRPQITAAAIYTAKGEVFATHLSAHEDASVLPARPGPPGWVETGDSIELFTPVRDGPREIGTVYLRAHYDITRRLFDYLMILFVVMAASLVIAALVTIRLQHSITMPILRMARVARDVMARRDFSLRAPKGTDDDDEVGMLVDAFNDMLAEVADRTAALERSNAQLSIEMAERYKAEEALKAAARTKDEFLATLAHELRNPLAPITNAVEILRRSSEGGNAMQRRAIEIVSRQVRQMVRLIDDLLDVSRISAGKVTLHKSRVDLIDVLHAALEIAMPIVEARGHRLELDLPNGPLFVFADATRLAQVFANLLNNAAKYTDEGGRICMALHRSGDQYCLRVRDSGVGIPLDKQDRIFDMFMQVDSSGERGGAGLGVGLSLARQLIDLHGGRIAVHSNGTGHGSEFSVWLPASDSADHTPELQTPPALAGPKIFERHRILVADDNVDFANSLSSLLESLDQAVTVVHQGRDALDVAAKLRPDFVFLDIGMPGLNGYEVAQQLRCMPATRHCVLVAITGWGQDRDRDRARAAGFDHHLVKPINVEQLMPILALGMPDVAAR